MMQIHVIDLGQCDLVIKKSKILQLKIFILLIIIIAIRCTSKLLIDHLLTDLDPADQDEYGSMKIGSGSTILFFNTQNIS